MFGDVCRRLSLHLLAVDGEDDVALAEPCLVGRHTVVRFVDDGGVLPEIVRHDGPYAAVFARNHLLQLLDVRLRIILRVRVERAQHGLYAGAHDLLCVERVDIHHVEVAVDVAEYLQLFRHLEVMVILLRLARRCPNDGEREGKRPENIFQFHNNFLRHGCRSSCFLYHYLLQRYYFSVFFHQIMHFFLKIFGSLKK